MLDQNDLLIFNKVVFHRHFSKAAEELKISKSLVSKAIQRLETQLAKKLIHRSTRQMSLTHEGEHLFKTTQLMQVVLKQGLEDLQVFNQVPEGLIKISLPSALGEEILMPRLQAFMKKYPRIKIHATTESDLVEIPNEKYDVIFRSAEVGDAHFVARKIMNIHYDLVATPEFIQQYGNPLVPEDLKALPVVAYCPFPREIIWQFQHAHLASSIVTLEPFFTSNSLAMLKKSILSGEALGILPDFLSTNLLVNKKLVGLLEGWQLPAMPLYLIYPTSRYLPLRIKKLIEFFKDYPPV